MAAKVEGNAGSGAAGRDEAEPGEGFVAGAEDGDVQVVGDGLVDAGESVAVWAGGDDGAADAGLKRIVGVNEIADGGGADIEVPSFGEVDEEGKAGVKEGLAANAAGGIHHVGGRQVSADIDEDGTAMLVQKVSNRHGEGIL